MTDENTAVELTGSLAEARQIIEAFAYADENTVVGAPSCNLKTERDYAGSYAVDAAWAWLAADDANKGAAK